MEEEGKPFVAVVDDEESVRRALLRLLRTANYRAEAFASAAEFLSVLPEREPQCLILDLQMPGMNGMQLHERLLELQIRPPIIVITAYDEPGTRDHCLASGIRFYFRKPVEADDLMEAVDEVVKVPEA